MTRSAVSAAIGLTRRRLLAASAGASALAGFGLPFASRAAAALPDGEVMSAAHWGVFYARVQGGRFTGVRPWEKDPRPSPMLPGVQDIVYGPTRIRYPMVRRAWLEKGPGAAPGERGRGDFVRVSWDKALDLVAGEIKRVQSQFGPWAIFGGSYGWRSAGRVNPQMMMKRLLNLSGGYVDSSEDYSKAAIERIMPYVVGSVEAEGPQSTYQTVLDHSQVVAFWGVSPIDNNGIANTVADHLDAPFFDALAKAGKRVIFIDPVRTDACKLLRGEWIAPRPGTDTAMMIGIAHTLLTEKLHDAKFLAAYTTGFDKFAAYLDGRIDGVAKTAEWASAICEVPAAKLRDLAHLFAGNRTFLVGGWATQRQQHGEQTPWMLITLAAMLGQIGLPGGGFTQRYHLDACGTPATPAPAVAGGGIVAGTRPANGKPWPDERGAKVIPCARIVDMLENPGGSYEFNGRTFRYPDMRLTYWVGGNPFHHHQDRNRQVAAWRKFETFIVQDSQWTASARMADIVLPSATVVERNDIDRVGPASGRAIVAMKQAIAPVFEARSDYDIFVALAQRLGVEQAFTTGKTELDWVRSLYDTARKLGETKKVPMPDFDTFWKQGIVEFEVQPAAVNWTKYADFRADPLLNPLPTPSGKIEIFSEAVEKMHYDDCPPHPTWLEPTEWLGQKDGKYPLHLDSAHPKLRLHSQLCNAAVVRRLYAVAGREPCLISTADAKARGIADGDVVRLFNDRGQVLAGAVVTGDVRPGVVRLCEGAWYDPERPGGRDTLCKYGDPNVLTKDVGTSRLAQGTTAHTAMVQIEKFAAKAPAVTVFAAPSAAV